eukprot:6214668-Pleurochrysis_carterae.AAC.2
MTHSSPTASGTARTSGLGTTKSSEKLIPQASALSALYSMLPKARETPRMPLTRPPFSTEPDTHPPAALMRSNSSEKSDDLARKQGIQSKERARRWGAKVGHGECGQAVHKCVDIRLSCCG